MDAAALGTEGMGERRLPWDPRPWADPRPELAALAEAGGGGGGGGGGDDDDDEDFVILPL